MTLDWNENAASDKAHPAPLMADAICITLAAELGREGEWPAEQRVTLDWDQVAGILDARLGGAMGT